MIEFLQGQNFIAALMTLSPAQIIWNLTKADIQLTVEQHKFKRNEKFIPAGNGTLQLYVLLAVRWTSRRKITSASLANVDKVSALFYISMFVNDLNAGSTASRESEYLMAVDFVAA